MTDIEADGNFPGLSSMLSFATAAFDIDKNLLGTFEVNLDLLPNAKPSTDTMKFWNSTELTKKAYAATRVNTVDPKVAMERYKEWLASLGGITIFVGYPAAYDFKWIDYYFHNFVGDNPYGFSKVIDVKSFAWSEIGGRFTRCTKRNMPKEWFDDFPHTHVAIDDAIEQGAMFINMLRSVRGLPKIDGIKRN